MSDPVPLSVVGDRLEEMGEACAALPRLLQFLLDRDRIATMTEAAMWAMVKLRDAGHRDMADAILCAMVQLNRRQGELGNYGRLQRRMFANLFTTDGPEPDRRSLPLPMPDFPLPFAGPVASTAPESPPEGDQPSP